MWMLSCCLSAVHRKEEKFPAERLNNSFLETSYQNCSSPFTDWVMLIEQFLVHFYSFTVLFIYSVGFKANIEPLKYKE